MTKKTIVITIMLVFAIGMGGTVYAAQQKGGTTSETRTSPDNTARNKYKANQNESADQQKEKKSDRKLTQMIRKAIVSDKTLSTYAHNVKIITREGMVTLKGPVRTEAEKKSIEMKAVKIAGEGKVKNEIEITPK